jgi:hypothetical protein
VTNFCFNSSPLEFQKADIMAVLAFDSSWIDTTEIEKKTAGMKALHHSCVLT